MSSFTIGVIDLSCQESDQSFFPPSVKLTTKSTTTVGKLLGFSEYQQFASNPPKKYRRITWSGTSEQTLFNGSTQLAGARYDYLGSTEIDLFGNVLSNYSKILSEMCSAADGQCQGIGFVSAAPFSAAKAAYNILGWIGYPTSQSCPGSGIPYTGMGDKAIIGAGDGAKFDSGFPSGVNFLPGGVFEGFNGTFAASSATSAGDSSSGNQTVKIFNVPQTCGTLVLQGPPLDTTSSLGLLEWNHNYSSTLDEEYTEFDALTTGITVSGSGATAAYIRNGFNVTSTNVAWTLSFSGLIPGTNYTATYRLSNIALGTITTVQLGFTATATTHSISGTIPAPPSGQSITISNPTVNFA